MKIAPRLGRLYVRYSPTAVFKKFLWERLNWRATEYQSRAKFGAKFSGNSLDMVQGYIYYFGVWEPNLSAFITNRILNCKERTFVDVGANIGYFSLLAATKMNGGQVVAIEAFPKIVEKLNHNININNIKNIRVLPVAATNEECTVEMYHGGRTNEGMTTSVPGKFKVTPISVKGMPIHKLLTESEISSIILIKIDVEGAEYSVLQGMEPIISRLPRDAEIVMEITPSAHSKLLLEEIFKIFKIHGFNPYLIDNIYSPNYYFSNQIITKPRRLTALPTAQADIVFSRKNSEYI